LVEWTRFLASSEGPRIEAWELVSEDRFSGVNVYGSKLTEARNINWSWLILDERGSSAGIRGLYPDTVIFLGSMNAIV
jgi:hypothetical protein